MVSINDQNQIMEITVDHIDEIFPEEKKEKSEVLSAYEQIMYKKFVAEIEDFFGKDGTLSQSVSQKDCLHEIRPQQVKMSLEIARCLVAGCHLALEAPTGIGKTYAYLIPAILLSFQKKQPIVISTHTITLQEQILQKDLPLLKKIKFNSLRFAIAKGRKNYLCLRRLNLLTQQTQEILPGFALSDLDKIYNWSLETKTGDRSELNFEPASIVWEQICCDPWTCMKSKCKYKMNCFLAQARLQMATADVIVANHAIYFSDLQQRIEVVEMKNQRGSNRSEVEFLLPDYAAVIFDEAHTLESVASDHLGISMSSLMVLKLLSRLYDAERGRGLLFDFDAARMAVVKTTDYLKKYFTTLIDWAMNNGAQIRYTQAGYIEDRLSPCLLHVERHLDSICKNVGNGEDDASFIQEIQGIQKQMFDIRSDFYTFCEMKKADSVYWLEVQAGATPNLTFNIVPFNLSLILNQAIFSNTFFTSVLTSATLATNHNMNYFLQRLGASKCHTMILDSEFDYKKQVVLWLTKELPEPQSTQFSTAIIQPIESFIVQTHGKAFVLFTSYKMMQEIAEQMKLFFEQKKIKLLIQGEGMPKSQMLETFKKDVNSVIFGTSSFWTGVDIPGESLSNVIIVKLPFAVPDHPVVQARCEEISRRGGNPFFEYSLPEAILQLRQGFGRLIRTRKDQGIVVILDRRIVTARYGQQFINSLPECEIKYF